MNLFTTESTMTRFCAIVAVLVVSSILNVESNPEEEIRFVTVVFRHGDRAPDDNGKELYPNDPYFNDDFFPMGKGGLTNSGKLRENVLGKVLREKYDNFIGDVYVPKNIEARSTNYRRTKMSLQLVLAGLFPPTLIQKWNSELNWQPIPTIYRPGAYDVLLVPEECPQYLAELNRVLSSPEVVEQVEEFRPFMQNLTILTGKLINNTNDMYYLYHDLMAEASMGLELPEWTNDIFPFGKLWEGTILEYEVVSYNDVLKKLNGGVLVRRITEDLIAIASGNTEAISAQKMNLFSGHETNVAALLQALRVYKPHIPEYSSAVIIELVEIEKRYYVKVLYYHGIPSEIETLQIPGCKELCELEDFLALVGDVIPTNEELVCPKGNLATFKEA